MITTCPYFNYIPEPEGDPTAKNSQHSKAKLFGNAGVKCPIITVLYWDQRWRICTCTSERYFFLGLAYLSQKLFSHIYLSIYPSLFSFRLIRHTCSYFIFFFLYFPFSSYFHLTFFTQHLFSSPWTISLFPVYIFPVSNTVLTVIGPTAHFVIPLVLDPIYSWIFFRCLPQEIGTEKLKKKVLSYKSKKGRPQAPSIFPLQRLLYIIKKWQTEKWAVLKQIPLARQINQWTTC